MVHALWYDEGGRASGKTRYSKRKGKENGLSRSSKRQCGPERGMLNKKEGAYPAALCQQSEKSSYLV